jgi:hypothetical protein
VDWKKVNNIIIVMLIVLNLVLWFLYNRNATTYEFTATKQAEVMRILERNNVVVYDHFPSFKPMQRLKIEPFSLEERGVIEVLMSASGIAPTVTSTGRRYEKEGIRIEIITKGDESGVLKYYNENQTTKSISESKALEIAREFANDIAFKKVKWELAYITSLENMSYMIQFNEHHRDYPIFSSYVKIVVNEKGVQYAEYKRMLPDRFIEQKQSIYSIDQVLYKLMYQFERNKSEELIRITNIDLGYDTKLNIYEEQKQYIEPHYRIRLGDGREYYINAYTNEIIE